MAHPAVRQRIGNWARGWLIAGAALGVGVGAIAAVGGFEAAAPLPVNARTGELIELARWDVTIIDCQILPQDEYRSSAALEIFAEVTNTWHATQYDINQQIVSIRLPNGERFGAGAESFTMSDLERHGRFDPGFARPAVLTAYLAEPLWSDPQAPVSLVLGDEALRDSVILDSSWQSTGAVASLELHCPVVV